MTDPFFATFREAYTGFEDWFIKKSNEELMYVEQIQALYLDSYISKQKQKRKTTATLPQFFGLSED